MIIISIVLFAIAAVGGLTMATLNIRGKEIPLLLAIGHGVFAAAGLITLIIVIVRDGSSVVMTISLILFIIIAIGGFILFSIYLGKKPLPNWLIAVHGIGAVISFILLLISLSGTVATSGARLNKIDHLIS